MENEREPIPEMDLTEKDDKQIEYFEHDIKQLQRLSEDLILDLKSAATKKERNDAIKRHFDNINSKIADLNDNWKTLEIQAEED